MVSDSTLEVFSSLDADCDVVELADEGFEIAETSNCCPSGSLHETKQVMQRHKITRIANIFFITASLICKILYFIIQGKLIKVNAIYSTKKQPYQNGCFNLLSDPRSPTNVLWVSRVGNV